MPECLPRQLTCLFRKRTSGGSPEFLRQLFMPLCFKDCIRVDSWQIRPPSVGDIQNMCHLCRSSLSYSCTAVSCSAQISSKHTNASLKGQHFSLWRSYPTQSRCHVMDIMMRLQARDETKKNKEHRVGEILLSGRKEVGTKQ